MLFEEIDDREGLVPEPDEPDSGMHEVSNPNRDDTHEADEET